MWLRCHVALLPRGFTVTWLRCHVALLSHGFAVTWLRCHVASIQTATFPFQPTSAHTTRTYLSFGCRVAPRRLGPGSLCRRVPGSLLRWRPLVVVTVPLRVLVLTSGLQRTRCERSNKGQTECDVLLLKRHSTNRLGQRRNTSAASSILNCLFFAQKSQRSNETTQ